MSNTNTPATKKTAGNDLFLRKVKAQMNGKIYREVLTRYNAEGLDSALVYLGQFFNEYHRLSSLSAFLFTPMPAEHYAAAFNVTPARVASFLATRRFTSAEDVERRLAEYLMTHR